MEKLLVAIGLGIYIGLRWGRRWGYSDATDDFASLMIESARLQDVEDATPLYVQAQRHAAREGWQ